MLGFKFVIPAVSNLPPVPKYFDLVADIAEKQSLLVTLGIQVGPPLCRCGAVRNTMSIPDVSQASPLDGSPEAPSLGFPRPKEEEKGGRG
jgi:hypothetical protein